MNGNFAFRVFLVTMDFSYLLTDFPTMVLAAVLALSFVGLSIHYGMVFLRLGRYGHNEPESERQSLPPVSVVLTVHNDGDWLRENLPYLLEQDYPNYEVVVVDFVSHDDTQFILQLCSEHYERLKIVRFEQDVNLYRGKKYPLSIGIQSAKNDRILLSEPECMPKDFTWIRSMMQGYRDRDTRIVLGFSGIRQTKSFFNWLQVYDNLDYYLRFFSSALSGHPYTGCSRNLSYSRSFFFEQGAFYSHLAIAVGADDFFVNQNANRRNIQIVNSPESFTMANSLGKLSDWCRFRRERTATRRFYSPMQRLRLLVYPLLVVLFYGAGAALMALHTFPWQLLAGLLVLKLSWQIFAVAVADKRFEVRALHWLSPIFEIYFLVANTFSALTPLSLKQKRVRGA